MKNQKPNTDAANEGSMAGQLSAFMRSVLMGVDDMLPATVVSYNDSTNKAVIKPLVMMGTTDGAKVSRATLANIPVFRFGGGGFFMRFPVKPGDFGWIKANDRDISLIFQRGGLEDWPNTERLKSFSDAMFFPDTMKSWVINGSNANAMVIQSMSGNVCISLHAGKAVIDTPLLEINSAAVAISGALLTHNGVNIGSTHKHGGVQPGGASTGGPS